MWERMGEREKGVTPGIHVSVVNSYEAASDFVVVNVLKKVPVVYIRRMGVLHMGKHGFMSARKHTPEYGGLADRREAYKCDARVSNLLHIEPNRIR